MSDEQFLSVTPYLRYPDGDAAIEWLSRVLGFGPARGSRDADGHWYEGEIAVGHVADRDRRRRDAAAVRLFDHRRTGRRCRVPEDPGRRCRGRRASGQAVRAAYGRGDRSVGHDLGFLAGRGRLLITLR